MWQEQCFKPTRKKILLFVILTIVMMFLPVIPCEQHCYTGPDSSVVSRNINSDALSIILDELFPVCGTCFYECDYLVFGIIVVFMIAVAYLLSSVIIYGITRK